MSGMRSEQEAFDGKGKRKKKEDWRLRRRSSKMKPTLWIGKEGLSSGLFRQLTMQLEASQIAKLKIQRKSPALRNLRETAAHVAETTGSILVDVRGHTFTLYKPPSKS